MGSQLSTKTSVSTASKEDNMDQYVDHIIQKKNKIESITPSNKITSDFCPSFSYCSYNHFFKVKNIYFSL